jgi:hypothetical protein
LQRSIQLRPNAGSDTPKRHGSFLGARGGDCVVVRGAQQAAMPVIGF